MWLGATAVCQQAYRKTAFPILGIDHELTKIINALYYTSFDFSFVSWQLQTDEDRQESRSMVAPEGLFNPIIIVYRTSNANEHMQSCIEAILQQETNANFLIWVNEVILYSHIQKVSFRRCFSFSMFSEQFGFLNPDDYEFYSELVRWCVHLVSLDGIKFDPS